MKKREIKSHVVLPVSVFRDHLSECLDLCVDGGRIFVERAGTHYLFICIGDAMRKDDIVMMSEIVKQHTHSGVVDMKEVLNTAVNDIGIDKINVSKDVSKGAVVGDLPAEAEIVLPVKAFLSEAKLRRAMFYGCGCKKVEGEVMCSKHERM